MSKKIEKPELEELNDEQLDEELLDDADAEYCEEEELPRKKRHRFANALLNNEGENNITSIKDLYKSFHIDGTWFKRNWSFLLTVFGCLLAFVTNRYQAQQEMIEEDQLRKELAEMRYKWLTRFSELTTSTRQSQIENRLKQLGDTTLTYSKQAPFIIRANK
ncbi:MAG: hypothetical protein MJZ60_01270 [Bacteroidaceae bacterium]|nr:hypothetical protein [Bacteroidaceae bacterium]